MLKKLTNQLTFPQRTHSCGELTKGDVGKHVKLCGWLEPVREMGGNLVFSSVRDRYGSTQIVERTGASKLLETPLESCVFVSGVVKPRPAQSINKRVNTGDVEVEVSSYEILNKAIDVPFLPVSSKVDPTSELLRAKYRYLDLRSTLLQRALITRSSVAQTIRKMLIDEGFLEIETPILFKSTPEGAREFIVPTRRTPGQFYALPQSPQQYKQLLMAGGIDRYFQIAKCFRDEDLRADRQPEFTQVDIEMSFMREDGIKALIERLVSRIWKEFKGVKLDRFRTIAYQEAMDRFGSDKPDMRFGLEIQNQELSDSVVDVLTISGGSQLSGKYWKSLASKYPELRVFRGDFERISNWLGTSFNFPVEEHDVLLLSKRPKMHSGGATSMGKIRLELAPKLKEANLLQISDKDEFLWVESFPLFTYNEEDKRIESTHHPFTAPHPEDMEFLEIEPLKVRGLHYDLVLNGVELGGGSVRIHNGDLQEYVLRYVLGFDDKGLSKFNHLLQALRHGCPPHAGIALGFDRLIAILCNVASIRDVIAFPKSQSGRDLMVESPSAIPLETMKEYHI